MSFIKSKGFKYFKNLLIGLGAAVVLVGALFKLESWDGASELLIVGLSTEALIFLVLGILGPEKDYYWEKLYPGLDAYNGKVTPIAGGSSDGGQLDGEKAHLQLDGMITELQEMSKNLSSLRALQEVDFSGTSQQIASMTNFYAKLNEAMADLTDSLEDTRAYKEQIGMLNSNIQNLNHSYSTLNNIYGNVVATMTGARRDV
ncbi:MAG: gliding motility protein GldL [Saprospiraceae bacterium]|jgi:uncharacterized coiled-coil protein SlyX